MPRMCSVFGCKSNYRSCPETVTTFCLPKDDDLRRLWLRKIPTDITHVKKPVVCIKHFPESCIITCSKIIVNGEMKEVPRKYPKLMEGSVPSIFPDAPQHLSDTSVTSKSLCDVEQERMDQAIYTSLISFKKYSDIKNICSFNDINDYFDKNKVKLNNGWAIVRTEDKCLLYLLSDSDPSVLGAIVVEKDMSIKLHLDGKQLSQSLYPERIFKLKDVHQLEALIYFIQSKISDRKSETSVIWKCLEETIFKD